jgi:NAD+ diphosphatase
MNHPDPSANPFSSIGLDRRAAERAAANWLDVARQDPACRFVAIRALKLLVTDAAPPSIGYLPGDHVPVAPRSPDQFSLLGWVNGRRHVLVEVPEAEPVPAGFHFEELRPLLNELPAEEAALLHCARALSHWRARHRHCSLCGAPTAPRLAGHALRCTNSSCHTDFFPRIDPAIIVLVSSGEHALLGRQPAWPAGRYSALAGFVEVGESLEDTVIREVFEETAVRVQATRYIASQGWPFPSSLMLGFHATAARDPIMLDGELEEARWFHHSELRGNSLLLPPRHTIARRLIDHWLISA